MLGLGIMKRGYEDNSNGRRYKTGRKARCRGGRCRMVVVGAEQEQEGMVMFTGVGAGGGLGVNWNWRRVDGGSGEGPGVVGNREGSDGAIAEAEAEDRGGTAEDRTGAEGQSTTGAREEREGREDRE
ncbi:hypothetical protein K435DRAFT_784708 [Dendrothele bispora CBS 962.96]|uniref:Uncharacterized protein n=1 Tax=Dendrothele bispora (strain CBS 962.96) TaxID=1314807 RepID=A0A4S8L1J3_DENBC|nr:hypothetical protein K435DRAFT_784708 [Dendrothele bispora CBS 962.96]